MNPSKRAKAGYKKITRLLRPYARWEIALGVIGAIAVIGAAFALLFAPERLTEEISSKDVPPPSSSEFLRTVAYTLGTEAYTGGEATILENGDGFLEAFLEDVADAQETITFANYIWHGGEFSDKLADAFSAKAREGVRVLLLLDDLGSVMPRDQRRRLEDAGVEVAFFRAPQITSFKRTNERTHRRVAVIDGRIGYEGGVAVSDPWLGDADRPDRWRDTMVRVTGPVVPQIQSTFAELWTAVTGEILGPKFYVSVPESAEGLRMVSVNSTPAPDTQKLPLIFWYSFASARESIYLTNPYFLPRPALLEALADAAKRGVDVRLLLPSGRTDAKYLRLAGQNHYAPLLEAGAKIYEYQPAMLHAKTFVVDGVWSVVGSANMDSRSVLLNEENVVGIQDDSFGKDMQTMFLADTERAKEITQEEWGKRDWMLKVAQYAIRIFEKQL